MKHAFVAERLDVPAFIRAGALLEGQWPLARLERLADEAAGQDRSDAPARTVVWRAEGLPRTPAGGATELWLRLQAELHMPLVCQRCMGPLDLPLEVDREFRFVADEATAARLDDESEHDVLVASREFDLVALIEDELLMALPIVPRHETCPEAVRLTAEDPDFQTASAAREKPFAGLARLRVVRDDDPA